MEVIKTIRLICVECAKQLLVATEDHSHAAASAYSKGWREINGKVMCEECVNLQGK